MAGNIPPGAGQINTAMQMQVPVTLVSTVPMGVPPLAQLTPSVPNMVQVQQQQQQHTTVVSAVPTSIQNNLATSRFVSSIMQVQSVVPATLASPMITSTQSKPATVVSNPTASSATSSNATSTSTSHNILQSSGEGVLLSRVRLQDLVREVDSTEQLDEEVEDLLLQLADDFVESTVNAACLLAKHRKATTVEVKDVQLHLERNWNMWTPGFGTDELRPYKRAPVTEAHKQRLALIRKAIKKY